MFSIFSVISVRFFLQNGFYKNIVEGERMFIMNIMCSFLIICVPLFMTLSGFLMRNKKLTLGYYKKFGKPTLHIYWQLRGRKIERKSI